MSLSNFEDAAEETLAELTQYKLPQSTTGAIVSRRFTTWYPAGSNVYGPSGTRSVRFVLAGDQGLVIPDTLQAKFCAKASNGTGLNSDAGIAAAFTRLRVYCAGALVEDISHYSRNFQLMRMTGSKQAAENMGVTIGLSTDTFPSSGELVLSMPLLCGMYYCGKGLPLKLCGQLVFELEVTPTSTDFADAAWTLEAPELSCDIVEAPEIQEALVKRVLSGSSIPISMNSFFSTMTSVSSDSTVNISRSLSKLCRVFISYVAASGDSEVDIFRHPTGSFEIQMRVGSRMVPENAIKDDPQAWYNLTKALGIHADSSRDINITKSQFAGTRYVVCLSTEKLLGAPFAGTSIKNGDIVNLQHKNAGGVGFQYALLEFQQILSLGEVPEVLQ